MESLSAQDGTSQTSRRHVTFTPGTKAFAPSEAWVKKKLRGMQFSEQQIEDIFCEAKLILNTWDEQKKEVHPDDRNVNAFALKVGKLILEEMKALVANKN